MRYELFRLAQLAFALALMFGAFLGGVAVGWWRWGREAPAQSPASAAAPSPGVGARHRINPDLFTPAEPSRPTVDLTAGSGLLAAARPEELAAPIDPFT